jgi:hypothetical protein
MTMLDDLREVVRLFDKLPKSGVTRTMYADAALAEIAAVNFFRTHAAQIEQDARDAERLNLLESLREAYGFENCHEGNRWVIDGPFNTAREALDAMAKEYGNG